MGAEPRRKAGLANMTGTSTSAPTTHAHPTSPAGAPRSTRRTERNELMRTTDVHVRSAAARKMAMPGARTTRDAPERSEPVTAGRRLGGSHSATKAVTTYAGT